MRDEQSNIKGVPCDDWPVTEPGSASDRLVKLVQERFGKSAYAELLVVLASLTYWTPQPVSVRVVGDSSPQDEVAELIAALLRSSVVRLTSATAAGLLAIEKIQGTGCVVLDGRNIKRDIHPILYPLLAAEKVRVLDGSPTGLPRDRLFTSRFSWIITNGDHLFDPDALSHLITLRIPSTSERRQIRTRRRLMRWSVSAKAQQRPFDIREHLKVPRTAVAFPAPILDAVTEVGDIDLHRVESLLALAGVWHVLKGGNSSARVDAELSDVEDILRIMEAAGVEDHRDRLSRQATDCLIQIRKKQSEKRATPKRGAKYQDSKSEAEGSVVADPLTFYSVQQMKPFLPFSIDAVRLWVLELEQLGLLERVGKHERKIAFNLTRRGRNWKPRILAQALRRMLDLSPGIHESNNFGLHSPTVGDTGS